MPKFLNHLDLNGNQLKNTKLEITDSPLAEEGVIHYHDTNNTIRYHNGSGFITLGDNDAATATAAGVVELFSDTAQAVAANSVSATTSRTYGIQLNGSGQMVVNVPWEDTTVANTNTQNTTTLSFVDSTDDILIRNTTGGAGSGTDDIKIVAGTNITLTHTDADNFTISSTDTNTQLNNGDVIGKVLTGLSTATGGAVAATDTLLVGFGKLEKRVALNDAKVTNAQVSTDVTLASVTSNYLSLSGQTITAATVPVVLGGTGATTASAARTNLDVDQSGTDNSTNVTLGTGSHDYLSISGQAITLAAVDAAADISGTLPVDHGGTGQTTVSAAANALLNASQGGALTIGDASDTITIAGNLTVEGTQTTIDSTTVATGDNMLELAKDNSANATDFGWYGKFIDSGTKYAGMNWDASATKFKLGYGDDAPGGTIDWDVAGHLEVGKLTTTDLVIGGHTISDLDITSEDSGADDHLMTAAAIVALIADNESSFSTATGVENNADVTDATNVAAAGAAMDGDFTAQGFMIRGASSGSYSIDTNTYITSQRAISSTPTDGATTTAISSDYIFDNLKTAVPTSAVFTDTVNMGSGFTVAATTTGTGTTITQGDSLTIAAGTGITTTGTSDGIVTIVNSAPNVTQTTITGNAGSATVLEAGAVGGVKVVELTHGADGVVGNSGANNAASHTWTITHGMGNGRFYKVEVLLDSGDYDTVYVDVQRPLDTTIKITFGAAVANGAYRAMITRMA